MIVTGAVIRSERQRVGWSQDELARQSGCTKKEISDWERQVKDPPVLVMSTIRKVLEKTGANFAPLGPPAVGDENALPVLPESYDGSPV